MIIGLRLSPRELLLCPLFPTRRPPRPPFPPCISSKTGQHRPQRPPSHLHILQDPMCTASLLLLFFAVVFVYCPPLLPPLLFLLNIVYLSKKYDTMIPGTVAIIVASATRSVATVQYMIRRMTSAIQYPYCRCRPRLGAGKILSRSLLSSTVPSREIPLGRARGST